MSVWVAAPPYLSLRKALLFYFYLHRCWTHLTGFQETWFTLTSLSRHNYSLPFLLHLLGEVVLFCFFLDLSGGFQKSLNALKTWRPLQLVHGSYPSPSQEPQGCSLARCLQTFRHPSFSLYWILDTAFFKDSHWTNTSFFNADIVLVCCGPICVDF